METIKKGSTGETVKYLLKILELTQDGIFGKNTESKVKEFLKSKGLTVDGIVGNTTWNALEEYYKCIDSSVIYMPLPKHITKCINREIKYLVIHYTGGSSSKQGRAKNNYNVFIKKSASADFGVDDNDIVQFNPDLKNYYCWSIGDKSYGNNGGKFYGKATNRNSISIEICSNCYPVTLTSINTPNHSGWTFTEEALLNAIKLAKIIMKKYNIDINHVIRHYDVSGKLCPALIGWNDELIRSIDGTKTNEYNNSNEWIKFKSKLE